MAADEPLPTIVIVGRPNVGKSTLFNAILGDRRSIVGDEPGITRDRIYGEAEYLGKRFGVIDTGGIIPHDDALIPTEILKQARVALNLASHILYVIDGRTEITAADRDLAKLLRTLNKPLSLVVNKIDAVDESIREGNTTFRIVDTAGIRRKGKTTEITEKLSVIMARRHIRMANIVLLIVDATEGVVGSDATIAGYAHEEGRGVIIVVNKWDAAEGKSKRAFTETVRDELKFLDYAPVLFASAKNAEGIRRIFSM